MLTSATPEPESYSLTTSCSSASCTRQARIDANTLARDVAWLSAQHAEESALRKAQKREVEELRAALAREQAANEHAVDAYALESEERWVMTCSHSRLRKRRSAGSGTIQEDMMLVPYSR